MKRAHHVLGAAVVTLLAALITPAAGAAPAAPASPGGKREPIPAGLCSVKALPLTIGGTGLSATDSDTGLPVTAGEKAMISCTDLTGETTETGMITASDIMLYGTCLRSYATGTATVSWKDPAGVDLGTSSGRGTFVIEQSAVPPTNPGGVSNTWDVAGGAVRIDLSSKEFGGLILDLPAAQQAIQAAGTSTAGTCVTGLKEVTLTLGMGQS
jgi:hypothetical protein